MNEKINYAGGEPTINFNDLYRNNVADRAALFGVLKAFNVDTNENFIISGCVPSLDTGVDVDVTAGYIFLNGEILEVEAQTVVDGGTLDVYKYVKSTTFDANGTKTFNDSTVRQTWAKHRGIVTAATTPILTTELDVISGDTLQDKISKILNTNDVVKTKVIEVGVWDMNTSVAGTAAPAVAPVHGLAYADIIGAEVLIRTDTGLSNKFPLNYYNNAGTQSGNFSIGATAIALFTITGGIFDSTQFNEVAGYNRGWIIIRYMP